VRETGAGDYTRQIEERSTGELPGGDSPDQALVKVLYSSLNYKDALSATGNRGVTRRYPHTPGIDAAGVVVEGAADFHPGDEVLAIGYDLGMNTPGGFGQYIRVPAAWLTHRPAGLSLRESMAYGTAGFTAAMCVERLIDAAITPDRGDILVTGASGGVGSIAVALLAKEGYRVVAATGKPAARDLLLELGAAEVIARDDVTDQPAKALLSQRWAGAVDIVGGGILAAAIKSTRRSGAVVCCGNVASPDLALTVYPFILRGVSLLGIDMVESSLDLRRRLWAKLAGPWRLSQLDRLTVECSLDELGGHISRILQGQNVGRVVVNLWA
jgi:putative YhdH/YhfP family quinone oxidoreductase